MSWAILYTNLGYRLVWMVMLNVFFMSETEEEAREKAALAEDSSNVEATSTKRKRKR